MEINSKPEELDELERKIMQLEIEKAAILRENDVKKLDILAKELANLNQQKDTFLAKWKAERDVIDAIQKSKEDIENLKIEADNAERSGDYGKVAEIRYGKIKETENLLESNKAKLAEIQANSKMIKEEVSVEEIAEVVSKWTGIPVSKMVESERSKLLRLEDELNKRVVGQNEAIEALSDAVRRSRAGLQDAKRPIGSFIFLGTTGVGKTELAKALAEYLFNDENAMTRIDMSEYQEKHSVSRFNILLQVLDDGRLTDNKGRVVNFKNTIIIMTSNLGSHLIQETFEGKKEVELEAAGEKAKLLVMELLKQTIRPEFLNRIDETIMFTPLTKNNVKQIVQIQFNKLKEMLLKKDIKLVITDEAFNHIAEVGYDPQFGARPVKRVIQRQVLNELSKAILGGTIDTNEPVVMDVFDHKIIFRRPIHEKEEI